MSAEGRAIEAEARERWRRLRQAPSASRAIGVALCAVGFILAGPAKVTRGEAAWVLTAVASGCLVGAFLVRVLARRGMPGGKR